MNENKNAHKDIATTPRPQMAASGRHSKENNRMNPRALSLRFISLVVVRLFDTLENNLPVIRAVGQCRL